MRDVNSRSGARPTEPGGASTSGSGTGGSEPGSVHVIVHSDRTRIVLSGEVDADLGPDLAEATADAEATGLPLEVDAQHVTFMDSSGIAFLARRANRVSERVRIIQAPETVLFLLEVTRIGELLDVIPAGGEDAPATPARTPAHGLPTIGPGGRRSAPSPDDLA